MICVCPACGHHINEHSAVMLSGGLVYHQRCLPGQHSPVRFPDQVPLTHRDIPWMRGWEMAMLGLGCFGALFCWPVLVIILLIWIGAHLFARAFGEEARRR